MGSAIKAKEDLRNTYWMENQRKTYGIKEELQKKKQKKQTKRTTIMRILLLRKQFLFLAVVSFRCGISVHFIYGSCSQTFSQKPDQTYVQKAGHIIQHLSKKQGNLMKT